MQRFYPNSVNIKKSLRNADTFDMSKKRTFARLITCAAIFLLSGVSVNAANVSVMVIESGVRKTVSAAAWENGLMDVLFEAGHVVSNAQNLVLGESGAGENVFWDAVMAPGTITVSTTTSSARDADELIPLEAAGDLQEAYENGMDYFLLVLLDYADSTHSKPRNVTLKLFDTNPVKFITSQNYRWSSKVTSKADYYNAGRAMRVIIPFMGDQI